MRIDIISVLPELMESPFQTSIIKRAMEKGLAEVHFHQLRDWSIGKHRQVDDEPYGGGAGMVMMVEPLDKCISELKSQRNYDEIIYLTPEGETLNQKIANTLSIKENLMLICGHYKGDRPAGLGFAHHEGDFYWGLCTHGWGACRLRIGRCYYQTAPRGS